MKRFLTLGELIKKLEELPQEAEIYFEFCRFVPTTFLSYRGHYQHLALGFSKPYDNNHVTVVELLRKARECVGKTFQGYTGGDYVMGEHTVVYVSDYGETSDTIISDIVSVGWEDDSEFLIVTKNFNL